MEEIEIYSWTTLDAIKKAADIIETVGDLHSDHQMSVFCVIEDDYLELCYSDSSANYLRRYEDEEEFEKAIEERKEELSETSFEDDDYEEDFEEDEELDLDDESDEF
ncbi:MAG: hypothetical protein ACPLZD_01980 [Candidatus Saccharicenans sp.]|nr:MAG: hypothetical protein C0168_05555 [Candidatus Aminicenantes bacterium]HEK85594.1 hypothetical protein [Candidatus Aminicenantes bacterium]